MDVVVKDGCRAAAGFHSPWVMPSRGGSEFSDAIEQGASDS